MSFYLILIGSSCLTGLFNIIYELNSVTRINRIIFLERGLPSLINVQLLSVEVVERILGVLVSAGIAGKNTLPPFTFARKF